MKYLIRSFAASVLLLGLMAGQAAADHLRVTVVNKCNKTINVATHARNAKNTWVTRGWYVLTPGQSKSINLQTTNKIYYLYAYSADANTTWSGSGKTGAITKYVRDRKFTRVGSAGVSGSGWRIESFFKSNFAGQDSHNRHNFRC